MRSNNELKRSKAVIYVERPYWIRLKLEHARLSVVSFYPSSCEGLSGVMAFSILALLALFAGTPIVLAQLTGSVGPTTSLSQKQATICNVLDYGGSVGSSVRRRARVLILLSLKSNSRYRILVRR